ncbi:DUF4230 domain-containing protein [Bergeyella cardium]|uniref:DUF4230 domain-containing protein n=1 Tax=Bergeyella cardium TaxID=1585976 RepID=A0A6P1QQK3_9FLAO|nr:DUF4230 domain-containing protein [Bergeyella cardium]QHN64446.1 DUF4230 domain-containing protein [Bergeyella cardium]WHE33736.1 DUF4230 domain-containing protein [Bergeyella cardium]WHF60386.1 DUF4230 domain-containing protein [Bergeyella cardium]
MKEVRFKDGLLMGFLLSVLVSFAVYFFTIKGGQNEKSDYYLITNQIQKMNKMVVVEQDFSSMERTKITRELFGGTIPGTEKSIITFTKTNVQVSYDLNKMNIEVDSTRKRLIIRELPQPQVRILPSVEIQAMDDSFLSRFSEEEIKKITQSAKDKAYKSVNQERLISNSKKQLIENLEQIFVLAQVLGYSIEDDTKTLKL